MPAIWSPANSSTISAHGLYPPSLGLAWAERCQPEAVVGIKREPRRSRLKESPLLPLRTSRVPPLAGARPVASTRDFSHKGQTNTLS